jgi:hypothetical protein
MMMKFTRAQNCAHIPLLPRRTWRSSI